MNRKTFEALQEDSSTFAYDDIFDEIQVGNLLFNANTIFKSSCVVGVL